MIESTIVQYAAWWQPVGYILFFFGMMIEGDALLFMAAFLTHQGLFNPIIMPVVIFAGVLIGDLGWYFAGEYISNQNRLVGFFSRIAKQFDAHLVDRPFRTIFISKFMYGFHHAILMRAGTLKLDKKKFVDIDIAATICWMIIVGGLGYFSGFSFTIIRHYMRNAEYVVIGIVFVYFMLDKIFTEILKKEL